ncbi:hypothetical protein VNO78_06316 [Psophocarpus tetragonolobus]|uniref:Apple domain-containing protein n=1 Tax=Psophocarpus tetragonolobus TaxID=3891 RepID=A0AAN9SSX9_PSOTE
MPSMIDCDTLRLCAEIFREETRLKVADTTYTWLDETVGLEECRLKCLNNCSFMAYANSDIRGAGSGCVLWFGDLIDIKQYQSGGQDLFIRMQASELEPNPLEHEHRSKREIRVIVATTIAAICVVLLLSTYLICRVQRRIVSGK